jgi:hypothetical protein
VPHDRCGWIWKMSPPTGFDHRTVRPVEVAKPTELSRPADHEKLKYEACQHFLSRHVLYEVLSNLQQSRKKLSITEHKAANSDTLLRIRF